MKRYLLLFPALFLVFAFSVEASGGSGIAAPPPVNLEMIDPDAFEPGLVRIKFARSAGDMIGKIGLMKSEEGLVMTGLELFDELSRRFMLVEATPMLDMVYRASPQSWQFRKRHEEWGLHLWVEFCTLAKSDDMVSLVRDYSNLAEVEFAEPVYRIRRIGAVEELTDVLPGNGQTGDDPPVQQHNWTPNDPSYASNQWHFNNTGQTIGGAAGTPGADISMPEAWSIEKGSSSVIVAVLDGGIQTTHPDLAGNMWSGMGYNFVDDNANILPDNHGTHVAGTVAAVSNNGAGVAGIAGGSGSGNGVRLMSCQIFSGGSSGGIYQAFIYAADNGAAVSQNSWGYEDPGVFSQSHLDAIDYFNANGGGSVMNGGISIFAAGNDGTDDDWYPAYYSGTYAVAATNNQDVKASYSNYGAWIDVSAPGSFVYSTRTGDSYGYMSGTSMACPHVSGVAALVLSYAPEPVSPGQLGNIILSNTDNINSQNPDFIGMLGTGRLNAHNALLHFSGGPPPPQNPSGLSATATASSQITVTWYRNAANNSVMLAWSPSGTFGTPSNGSVYSAGQNVPGGGTVLYRGSATTITHDNLNPNTTYHYRAWSYNNSNVYSSGISTQASTPLGGFVISAAAGPGGSISPSGSVVVQEGQNQAFTITPESKFDILDVFVDGVSQGPVNTYQFTSVDRDHTIYATFVPNEFMIKATSGAGGSINPAGDMIVKRGQSQAFFFAPDAGFRVDEIYVDGLIVSTASSYTFANVVKDHTIYVTFKPDLWSIAASASNGGIIDPSGTVDVIGGTDITFNMYPDEGFYISNVYVNGREVGAVGSHTFKNVRDDQSIHVAFSRIVYTIAANPGEKGTITPSGNVKVFHGDDQLFIIAPDEGHHIKGVIVDGLPIGPVGTYTFTGVVSDHTIEAFFDINMYTVSITTTIGGTVTPTSDVLIPHGGGITYYFIPDPGYRIIRVFINGVRISVVNRYTFFNIRWPQSVQVDFMPVSYQITATSAEGGTISPTGTVSLTVLDEQTFVNTPDEGWHIKDVLVDEVSVGPVPSYTFKGVTSNRSIHTEFDVNTYTIQSSAGPGGKISPAGETSVGHNEDITFVIEPDEGSHIADVLIDGESVGAVTSYTFGGVMADHDISAVFAANTYLISATAGEGGSITPKGEVEVLHGTSQKFVITPDPGYAISDVLVDGSSVGRVEEYLFSNIASSYAIHAAFELLYNVNFNLDMTYAPSFNSSDGVYLIGSFSGWDGPGAALQAKSDQGGKAPLLYRTGVELPAGRYEYIYFLNNYPAGMEWEQPPYRSLTVPDTLETYDFFGYRTDPTSLHHLDESGEILVYPNPAQNDLYIAASESILRVTMTDTRGREVHSARPEAITYSLEVSGLPTGVYIIRVVTVSGLRTWPVIITR